MSLTVHTLTWILADSCYFSRWIFCSLNAQWLVTLKLRNQIDSHSTVFHAFQTQEWHGCEEQRIFYFISSFKWILQKNEISLLIMTFLQNMWLILLFSRKALFQGACSNIIKSVITWILSAGPSDLTCQPNSLSPYSTLLQDFSVTRSKFRPRILQRSCQSSCL